MAGGFPVPVDIQVSAGGPVWEMEGSENTVRPVVHRAT